jgi:uncharacterized membrane protein YczE
MIGRNKIGRRMIIFFAGLLLIAGGSVQMIGVSSLGVQPFDVLYIGLHTKTPITIGFASIMTGLILLVISLFLTREKLKIGTILDTILLGLFVDLFLSLNFVPVPENVIGMIGSLFFGMILIGFGAALTIVSKLGAGPVDTFMLAIHKKFNISIKKAVTIIELSALIIGFSLGGPIGVGTLVFCFLIGPLIECFLRIIHNIEVKFFSFAVEVEVEKAS